MRIAPIYRRARIDCGMPSRPDDDQSRSVWNSSPAEPPPFVEPYSRSSGLSTKVRVPYQCRGVSKAAMTYEPIAEASTPDTCSAAAFTGSAARCAYLAVVPTCVWPSTPIIGSPWPAATAAEAKVWRRSWMRRP